MLKALRRTLSLTLVLVLAGLPLWSEPNALVGVARTNGPAEINGVAFRAEGSVFSGDRVSTGRSAVLTLVVSPQERYQLEANSQALVRKDSSANVISLEKGIVSFRSAGGTRAVIEAFGVEVRPAGKTPAIVQVALLSPAKAQVAAVRGEVEVKTPERSVILKRGQGAMLTATAQEPTGAGSGAGMSAGTKTAIALAIIAGLAVGIAVPVALANDNPVSPTTP